MLTLVRKKLTYANVVSSLALFAVLAGGTAIAASLPKGSVGGKQLKKNAVTSSKIKNGAILGKDLNAGTLGDLKGPVGPRGPAGPSGTLGGAAGGDLSGTYPNPAIANNAIDASKVAGDALTGQEIDESSLQVVPNSTQLASRDLPRVVSEASGSTATSDIALIASPTFVTVLNATQFAVDAGPADAVVNAQVTLSGVGTGGGSRAVCKLQQSTGGPFTDFGAKAYADFLTISGEQATIPLVGLANNLPSGANTIRVACTKTDGTVSFDEGAMTVTSIPE